LLLITVNPGFGGQAFVPPMLENISNARAAQGDRELTSRWMAGSYLTWPES
jgi:pentose-5-phosphate-3-epimerase